MVSAVSSQFISNVPAAMLLANFTHYYREVLLGLNIGGFGTLIASLANVISYRYYAREYEGTRFIKVFHIYNAVMLGVIGTGFVLYICLRSF